MSEIAQSLFQYSQSEGYSTDLEYCTQLSWGGLQGTAAFKALSISERNKILDVLNTEQNGTDRHGNPTTAKGTPSGCQ